MEKKYLNLVIDATTVKSGGGVHHLGILLKYIDENREKLRFNLKECIVAPNFVDYSSKLNLTKHTINSLTVANVSNFFYPLYQYFYISHRINKYKNPSFLVLTSLNFINSKNVYIMPQNLLPIDLKEIKKYGISIEALRLLAIRYLNLYSMKKAKKIFFLSKYAFEKNLNFLEKENKITNISSKSIINYLPINKLDLNLKADKKYSQLYKNKKIKLLYISRVDYYKNQDYVIKELELYKKTYKKNLEFLSAGYIYKPYYKKFKNLFSKKWTKFKDNVSYEEVLSFYCNYDIGIFASTCESCPTIVLEMMNYGLPFIIADLSLYDELVPLLYPRFNIGEYGSLSNALNKLLSNSKLIEAMISEGRNKVKEFSAEKSISSLLSSIN